MTCQLQVRTGRNVWLLARTDRDGATETEVLQTAVSFVHGVLEGGLVEHLQVPDGRPDVATAVIGAARPVVITAVRGGRDGIYRGPLPGELTARAQNCPGELMQVRATRPWFLRVGFDWRGADTTIDWPRLQVSWVGTRHRKEVTENDWLLVEARFAGDSPEGTDQSWVDAVVNGTGDRVADAVVPLAEAYKKVLLPVLLGVGAVVVVGGTAYIVSQLKG